MVSCATVIVTIVLIAILITSIVLMAKSFDVIDYNKIGLKKDSYSRSVTTDKVYRPGR